MKKLLIAITGLMLSYGAYAQPWMPANTHTPLKLADIIANYKKQQANKDRDENEEKEKSEQKGKTVNGRQIVDEDANYQFDRWVWYWKQHLDSNGYMVSPVKTQQEWDAYRAQQKQVAKLAKTTGESNWVAQGPTQSEGGYYGLGRINTVAFDPIDSNTFYIGSAGGGAWKTADNGLSWSPLYNDITSLGVSDIAVNPLNHKVIYVCTGDGDGGDTYSIGVIKTTDGGNTWNSTGLTFTTNQFTNVNSIIINPLDTNKLIIATTNGTYLSVNGGASWSHQNLGTDFKRVLYNPADTNIVYACSYENAQIYRSTNGGVSWTQVTSFDQAVRVNIAVTPANPAIVKAIVCNMQYGLDGIYSSSDSGATFTKIFDGTDCSNNLLANSPAPAQSLDCTGQGWYDLPIAISPVDSNEVLIGGVNTWASADGGATWQIANQWYSALPGIETAHADKHVFAFNPLTPTALYEGNDGGIYRTLNPTSELWSDLTNGLGITQFYRISVDNSVPFVIGGAQDNGCKMLNAGVASELTGGDGMQTQIDYSDPADIFYTEAEYGSINRTEDGGNSFDGISFNIPGNPTGDWITPFVIHPQVPTTLLAGYDQVYYSSDRGDSWSSISPSFPTLVGNPDLYIDNICIAPSNPNYIYVVISIYGYGGSSYIYYTTDFGTTWNPINNIYSRPISNIAVDPKNENHLWVTFSGYGTIHVSDYNSTTNTWHTQNTGLPNIPANCLAIDSSNGTLYLGTDVAVYYRDTTTTTWALYNTNLPSVRINDLGINYTTGELWAATFGRGMWKTMKHQDTASTGNNQGISIVPLVSDAITISPNPNKGSFTISTANTSYYSQQVTVKLIAEDGQTAWQNEGTFTGNGRLDVNAAGVAKGVYICEVKGDKVLARARVVIL